MRLRKDLPEASILFFFLQPPDKKTFFSHQPHLIDDPDTRRGRSLVRHATSRIDGVAGKVGNVRGRGRGRNVSKAGAFVAHQWDPVRGNPLLLPPADLLEFGHVWLAEISPPPFGLQEVLVRGDDAGGGRYLPRSLNVVVCVSRASSPPSLYLCVCKGCQKGTNSSFWRGAWKEGGGEYHRWLTLYRTKVFLNSTTYLGRCRLEFSFFPSLPAPLSLVGSFSGLISVLPSRFRAGPKKRLKVCTFVCGRSRGST